VTNRAIVRGTWLTPMLLMILLLLWSIYNQPCRKKLAEQHRVQAAVKASYNYSAKSKCGHALTHALKQPGRVYVTAHPSLNYPSAHQATLLSGPQHICDR